MGKIFIEVHQPRANERTLIEIGIIEEVYEIKPHGRYRPMLEEESGAKTLIYTRGRVIPVTETYRQIRNLIKKVIEYGN